MWKESMRTRAWKKLIWAKEKNASYRTKPGSTSAESISDAAKRLKSWGEAAAWKEWKIVLALVVLGFFLLCPQIASAASDASDDLVVEQESDTIRILFVGNSKTSVNDVPGKFAAIAESLGKNVEVTTIAIAGKDLSYIAETKAAKISKKAYDYVVIQESSKSSLDYSTFLSGAKAIAKLVRKQNPDVQIVVRKTWVLKSSSAAKRKQAYRNAEKVAEAIGAIVSEDGLAFDVCTSLYPTITLYKDTKHPSKSGAYLAACCVYAAIFQESPKGSAYTAGLADSRALKLQKIAAAVTL